MHDLRVNPKVRWAVLLSALAFTVAAVFYPLDAQVSSDSTSAGSGRENSTSSPVARDEVSMRESIDTSSRDPFEPSQWTRVAAIDLSPIAPPLVETIAAIEPPLPAPRPPLPPLPFRFAGRYSDAGEELVYLGRGDQIVLARARDTVDGIYRVETIEESRISFQHLPSGEKQILIINAPAN